MINFMTTTSLDHKKDNKKICHFFQIYCINKTEGILLQLMFSKSATSAANHLFVTDLLLLKMDFV